MRCRGIRIETEIRQRPAHPVCNTVRIEKRLPGAALQNSGLAGNMQFDPPASAIACRNKSTANGDKGTIWSRRFFAFAAAISHSALFRSTSAFVELQIYRCAAGGQCSRSASLVPASFRRCPSRSRTFGSRLPIMPYRAALPLPVAYTVAGLASR